MRILCYILVAGIVLSAPAPATELQPTDAAVLESLMSALANSLIEESGIEAPSTVFSSCAGVLRLSSSARNSFDAVLTARGFSLSDARQNSTLVMNLAVSNADIILVKSGRQWRRTVSLSVFLNVTGRNGQLLFSDSKTLSINDMLDSWDMAASDDSEKFARGMKRNVTEKKKNTVMLVTLALITGTLAFFAEQ